MREIRGLLIAGLVFLLCTALLFAIYFTLLEQQWIAFLAGILLAAVIAMVSQASRAH